MEDNEPKDNTIVIWLAPDKSYNIIVTKYQLHSIIKLCLFFFFWQLRVPTQAKRKNTMNIIAATKYTQNTVLHDRIKYSLLKAFLIQ